VHARIVRTGFDQWFSQGKDAGGAPPPPWKMNMLVLSQLYPVVFLFGLLVMNPLLMNALQLPFWLALFIANVASVIILNYLVPWTSKRFAWWLQPAGQDAAKVDALGIGAMVAIYAASLLVFSQL